MLLFHGIKVPDQFDNSNWSNDFVACLEKLKFSTSCVDLALQGKIRLYKFFKLEYLEIANPMRSYFRKNNKNDYYLLKSIPGLALI
jgi:transposase